MNDLRTSEPSLLSIIIPAYNADKHLAECIHSIQRQTYPHLEILLVDDGSTDETLRVARDLASHDSRLRIFTQANGGSARARNLGLGAAKGEYVAFVDADDWIDSDMYSRMMKMTELNSYDAVSCDLMFHTPSGSGIETNKARAGKYSRRDIENEIFPTLAASRTLTRDWPYRLVTKIYRRQHLLDQQIIFNETLRAAQDFTFSVQAMWRSKDFYYMKGWAPYHYRWNPASRTNTALANAWANYRALDAELSEILSTEPSYRPQLEVAALHGDLSVLTYLYRNHRIRGSRATGRTMRELLLAVDREGAFKQLDWRSIPLGKRIMCWLLRKRYYFGAHLLLMGRAQLDRVKMWRYAGEAVASEA